MLNDSDRCELFSGNSEKRAYASMKVTSLGQLADLTQAMSAGAYTDGALISNPNNLMIPSMMMAN
jgi:hypothetical protein